MPKSLLTAAVFSTLVLSVAAPSACTAAQDKSPDAKPAQEPAPAKVANPMASFARMVGGEWKMTAAAGRTGAGRACSTPGTGARASTRCA